MATTKNFILIDDDVDNYVLTKFAINKAVGAQDIKFISTSEKALEYIETEYSESENLVPTIIFLEINMPGMSGWEFLDTFSEFPEELKKYFSIYILSASIDERDKERAASYPIISQYIEKPLTRETALRVYYLSGNIKMDPVKNSFTIRSK